MLRSLPKWFNMKVTVIEEAHDITSMKVDELIGSLLAFELFFFFNGKQDKKNMRIAFQSVCDDVSECSQNLEEALA